MIHISICQFCAQRHLQKRLRLTRKLPLCLFTRPCPIPEKFAAFFRASWRFRFWRRSSISSLDFSSSLWARVSIMSLSSLCDSWEDFSACRRAKIDHLVYTLPRPGVSHHSKRTRLLFRRFYTPMPKECSQKLCAKHTITMEMAFPPGTTLKLGWVPEREPGTKHKKSMTNNELEKAGQNNYRHVVQWKQHSTH